MYLLNYRYHCHNWHSRVRKTTRNSIWHVKFGVSAQADGELKTAHSWVVWRRCFCEYDVLYSLCKGRKDPNKWWEVEGTNAECLVPRTHKMHFCVIPSSQANRMTNWMNYVGGRRGVVLFVYFGCCFIILPYWLGRMVLECWEWEVDANFRPQMQNVLK